MAKINKVKQIYYHNNTPYKVHRTIPRHNFNIKNSLNMELVQMWRDHLGCNHVLQNQTHFIFCETIPEAELTV